METNNYSTAYLPNEPYDFSGQFNHEKQMKRIQRTSVIGQLIMLLICMLAAIGLFAQPSSRYEESKKKMKLSEMLAVGDIQSFKVLIKNGNISLNWTMNKTKESCLFVIQKTRDGANYTTVGYMKGEPSEKKLCYSFPDEKPVKGVSYYRVKKISADDSTEYTGLVKVFSNRENVDDVADVAIGTVVPEK